MVASFSSPGSRKARNGPHHGDWNGILAQGTAATLSFDHVDESYAHVDVQTRGIGSTTITNSHFDHEQYWGLNIEDGAIGEPQRSELLTLKNNSLPTASKQRRS